jgi:hypothetical protein
MCISKRWYVPAVCVLLASPAIARPATSQTTQSVRKELEAISARFTRAYQQNDREAMRRLYQEMETSDYTAKPIKGKCYSKQENIASLDKGPLASVRFRDFDTKIIKLTVTGSHAITISDCRMSMDVPDPKGGLHDVSLLTTSRDTWIKTPHGWKSKSTVILKQKALVEGRPVRQ